MPENDQGQKSMGWVGRPTIKMEEAVLPFFPDSPDETIIDKLRRSTYPRDNTPERLDRIEAKLDRIMDILEGRLVAVPGVGSGRILGGSG